jgi:hypothetical protein
VTRYLEGILLLAVAFVPLQTGSFLWRARLMDDWRGGRARLVEIVMDVTVLILVSEILGSLDLYRVAPVVIALALVGVAAIWTARRLPSMSSEEPVPLPTPEERTEPRAGKIAALIVVSVVLAEWSTQTVSAYHHGMLSTDTLWYHMPFAARFVQDHSVTAIHYFDSGVTAFYPASSELVHAFGILTMGNDVLSPLLNTLWLGVALLASWCIGRPFGVGSVTLTGSAILFGTPGLVATQPGGAYDDVVGLAFMLSAVALLVNAQVLSERSQRTAWIMAAASSGLALGTKWTFIGPVAALTIGVWFVVAREKRIRSWGIWLVALLLTGGFWYGRNLIAVGNPIPPFHLKIGPLSLPSPQVTTPSSTVAHFLFNTTDWRTYFIPGLRLAFGPAWWALLGLSVLGLVLAVVKGDRLQRVLGLVGLASGVIFLFTPQYLVVFGVPALFVEQVRYTDAAVILGLVLLPVNPMLSTWARARWIFLAYGAVLAATQFDAGIWPTTFFTQHFVGGPVRGIDSLMGLFIGVAALVLGALILLYRSQRSARKTLAFWWIIIGAIVIAAGFPLQQSYLRNRYVESPFTWFQHEDNLRVGVLGEFAVLQYPFYGKNLSNYVQYLGVHGSDGTYSPFDSCQEWRDTINEGHYSYIYISTDVVRTRSAIPSATPPEARWMAPGRASKIVLRGQLHSAQPFPGYSGYTLYKVGPDFSADGCGAAARGHIRRPKSPRRTRESLSICRKQRLVQTSHH